MAYLNIYLKEEEKAWVKRQREGIVREFVLAYMAEYPEGVPDEGAEEDGED